MLILGAVVALGGAFIGGHIIGARSTSLAKCQERLKTANQQRDAAALEAATWRGRAERLQGRLQQIDRDSEISTGMLLLEIDKALGNVCEHGKTSGCDWCDQPAPYALTQRTRSAL